MGTKDFKLYVMDLKVRVKLAEGKEATLTPLERTVLLLAPDLDQLRAKRAAAKPFLRFIGGSAISMTFPDSFENIHTIKGVRYDERAKKDIDTTLMEYVNTTIHCLARSGAARRAWSVGPIVRSAEAERVCSNILPLPCGKGHAWAIPVVMCTN